jgi:hypothetical protein
MGVPKCTLVQVDVYQADFNAERQARERIAGEYECLYVLVWVRWMCTLVPSGLQC